MDNFEDIDSRIVNIHCRISCHTGVRVSIIRSVDVFIETVQYRFKSKFAFSLCVLH